MPAKQRESGYRVSIQLPEDVDRIIQRARAAYKKAHGFPPSRSMMITIMLRSAAKHPDWLESPSPEERNGQ